MATRQVGTDNVHTSFELNDILQQTQSTTQPGRFRRVLGAIAGGAANMFMPGIGGILGGLISGVGGAGGLGGIGGVGGLGGFSGLGGETLQFLQIQQELQKEARAFELASAVLKLRHDTGMSAIRNLKS